MYKQDDPYLNPIAKWGCFFTSLYNLVERETGNIRSKTAVLQLFLNALKAGWVDGEATIQAPDQILQSMGSKYRFKAKTDANYQCAADEAEILMFVKPGHTHFVLGDGQGKIAYDPLTDHDMSPYKLMEKRIYKRSV